jgi:beta-alanine degradation protein BauB
MHGLGPCHLPFRMCIRAALLVCFAFLFASSAGLFATEDIVQVDNQFVRITEVVYSPHVARTIPREGTNRVQISLDAGNIQLMNANGQKRAQHWKTGQAVWIPAGESSTRENSGSTPMQVIEIELKNPGPTGPTHRNPKLDPIAIDSKHNILLLENDQVRVFRSWREPGATEKMHEHTGAGRAAVLLSDLKANVKVADGATSMLKASAGDVLWSGPVTHATTNLGPKQFDMIIVEVK